MLSTHLLLINIISILLMFVGLTVSLKCFICHTNDNRLCTNDTLKDCPSIQAYDRCMTTIYRDPKDGLHIRKECALAPCHLRDPKIVKLLSFKESCNNPNEDCIHCCPTDGCNTDGVSMINGQTLLITSMISLITLFPFIFI